MSVNTETQSVQGNATVLKNESSDSVYASLFEKINLTPVKTLSDISEFQDNSALADERVTAAIQVFMQVITKSGHKVEMTDPGDDLQASHSLRDAKFIVEDIEDNPGFFSVKLFAAPHFQVEGMDVNLSLVSQMLKAKA